MEFPTPSPPSSSSGTASALPHPTWAHTTPEATDTLLRLLKDNHDNYHVLFSSEGEDGLHNHAAHYTLTLWALGAQKNTLEAAYDLGGHREVLHDRRDTELEVITNESFSEHLGDDRYYKTYLDFFKKEMQAKSVPEVLEEYIFNLEANFEEGEDLDSPSSAPLSSSSSEDEGKAETRPNEMLATRIPKRGMYSRLYDGLMHAFIHLGCGLEMGLPGLTAEGLASVAIHQANTFSCLFPPSWWDATLQSSSSSRAAGGKETHAFDILARMSTDSRLRFKRRLAVRPRAVARHQEVLREYASQWTFDAQDPEVVRRKVEELVWMNVLLYGVGGRISEEEFRADFYLMHLVNSSIFLSTFMTQLKPAYQELCLRGYFITTLIYWLTRGRPVPDIRSFMSAPLPTSLSALPQPSPTIQLPNGVDHSVEGAGRSHSEDKLWEEILETTITFPDDHLPKLQRALSHFAKVYGKRKAGEEDFRGTELDGAECLDGSLFIRTAALTMQRLLGKGVKEYSPVGNVWDHKGF